MSAYGDILYTCNQGYHRPLVTALQTENLEDFKEIISCEWRHLFCNRFHEPMYKYIPRKVEWFDAVEELWPGIVRCFNQLPELYVCYKIKLYSPKCPVGEVLDSVKRNDFEKFSEQLDDYFHTTELYAVIRYLNVNKYDPKWSRCIIDKSYIRRDHHQLLHDMKIGEAVKNKDFELYQKMMEWSMLTIDQLYVPDDTGYLIQDKGLTIREYMKKNKYSAIWY